MKSPVSSQFLRRIIVGVLVVAAPLRSAFADVVLDWNAAMTHYSEIQPPPGVAPFAEARAYAMAHIAMRDAVTARGINQGINNEAAAAQAAHDVLVAVLPGGTLGFDTLLSAQMAAIANGTGKTAGIALGAAHAARVLADRANDGSATPTSPYTPGTNPGDYQPTPPFNGPPFNGFVDAVNWGKVKPFSLVKGSQFRVPAPYKVTDLDYAFDLNEIKALGSATSTVRSSDQTDLALFWYESSPMGWNRIARLITAQHALTLVEQARLFAALNGALADAYIAAIESKFTYNFWRPITAIRAAATDGNPATAADPTWESLFLTPPIPDYPSAHACAGGAAATVLISVFGDDQTFTLASTMSFPFPSIQPRTFHKISDAAKENALSRMLVGIHFRLACEVGLEQGTDIGRWVVKHEARSN
ncbi:MAG: vanadium-dependent haloperoxidase [Opitutus sp.]